MTNRRYLVPGDLESEHGVSQSVRRARTLRIHTGDETAAAHAQDGSSPRWFREDSPETRARPALSVDSTPLLEMREKNLTRPLVFTRPVFTRRDNSLVSFICRVSAPSPSTSSCSSGCVPRAAADEGLAGGSKRDARGHTRRAGGGARAGVLAARRRGDMARSSLAVALDTEPLGQLAVRAFDAARALYRS
jgi:hypothetical protein